MFKLMWSGILTISCVLSVGAVSMGSPQDVSQSIEEQRAIYFDIAKKIWGFADVGDVSWNVPSAQLRAATFVPGTPGHSWQAVACGGMSIGFKGMIVAAKTLALTAVEVLEDPNHVEKARTEFLEVRGPNFKYEPLIGDRKPALDYRK